MRHVWFTLMAALLPLAAGRLGAAQSIDTKWLQAFRERLPLYGHRNWIVIADSAYPMQSRSGIETLATSAGLLEVAKTVLAEMAASRHVRPNVFIDKELQFVDEKDSPGVSAYREKLAGLLKGREVTALPHEEIISKLDQAGQTFRVLIIKTNMTIPYTSLFLQLDCGYWSAEAEQRMRDAMKGK